ncbi:peptidoglycan-binding LysM [Thelonectria olida]|uniref:Peptidoglycan-binding LysM n=1 Tax=Thelonectria olida TaxID=1576542 RepID=A0A9P8W131_9HYPO|nr:peptidoglycan-binding LysM [Thelonectria olida]
MSRFSRYDTDEERLPEGMERVGYDADTQVYTFRDVDGSYWEGAPGSQYGHLTKVSEGDADDEDHTTPFLGSGHHSDLPSWRNDLRPLLNFGVLIGVSLLLLFWFLRWSAGSGEKMEPLCPEGLTSYTVQQGDSCWDIADKHGLTVDDLIKSNTGLDCKALQADSKICLPESSSNATDPIV